VGTTPEQFGEFLRAEYGKWDRMIREAGIKAEG
jgi:tripartite-type tricarboxylate transporter receptor subunit TctC